MSAADTKSENLQNRLPPTMRWVNLDNYGIKFKLAYYKQGPVLVAENGDAHEEALGRLGFQKVGNMLIKPDLMVLPRHIQREFPLMTVDMDKPSFDLIEDRLHLDLPAEVKLASDSDPVSVLSRRIAEKAGKTTLDLPTVKMWFAEVVIGDHTIHAFGVTPEQAMRTLSETWNAHAQREGEDADLLAMYRSSIAVNPVETGRGYSVGIHDGHWYRGGYNGEDSRFDGIIPEVVNQPRRGPQP